MKYSIVLIASVIVIYVISLCVTDSNYGLRGAWLSWFALMLVSSFFVCDKEVIHIAPIIGLTLLVSIIDSRPFTLAYLIFTTIYMSDLAIMNKLSSVAITCIYIASIFVAFATERQWIKELISLNCMSDI